jgi:hypothetical protein
LNAGAMIMESMASVDSLIGVMLSKFKQYP